jgi:hypothetical protein
MNVKPLEEWTALQLKREEEKPRAACVKYLREALQGFVVQRHEEVFTHGTPDMSVAGVKRGSWWEFKYAIPDKSGKLTFKSKGVQELNMIRLARATIAWYIIFSVEADGKRHTHIVEPNKLADWEASPHRVAGFDYKFIARFIYESHIDA